MGEPCVCVEGPVYGLCPQAEVRLCGSLCVRRVRRLSAHLIPVRREGRGQTVRDGLWPHKRAWL